MEIFFTFDLVWVPGFGMVPQTTFDLFFSCFSKCEAMEQCTCMILNNFVGVALSSPVQHSTPVVHSTVPFRHSTPPNSHSQQLSNCFPCQSPH